MNNIAIIAAGAAPDERFASLASADQHAASLPTSRSHSAAIIMSLNDKEMADAN